MDRESRMRHELLLAMARWGATTGDPTEAMAAAITPLVERIVELESTTWLGDIRRALGVKEGEGTLHAAERVAARVVELEEVVSTRNVQIRGLLADLQAAHNEVATLRTAVGYHKARAQEAESALSRVEGERDEERHLKARYGVALTEEVRKRGEVEGERDRARAGLVAMIELRTAEQGGRKA